MDWWQESRITKLVPEQAVTQNDNFIRQSSSAAFARFHLITKFNILFDYNQTTYSKEYYGMHELFYKFGSLYVAIMVVYGLF